MKLPSLLLLFLTLLTVTSHAAEKPNILFIIADQWRAQAFGFAGDPNVKTPHIDELEKQSVNFTQAVAGTPVCTVTRATLLTGQHPLTHGVFLNDVYLAPEALTLAEVLRAAGYDTGCIGKWHIDGHGRSSYIPRERRQGFDYWKVLECTHNYGNSFYYADGPEKLKWDGYDATAQTRDARQYLKAHALTGRTQSKKPFLLWLAWGPPHNPYKTAPAKYWAQYPPKNLQLRDNVPPESAEAARRDLSGYYAHCTALDDCIGDLMTTLQETRLAENTIVVFTSDHGDMLASHGLQRKQKPFEESARVPMLIRLPKDLGIQPGRVDGTINSEDIMPTLLSLCDVPTPGTVEGLDFTPYLHGGEDPSGGYTLIQCASPFGEFARTKGGREYRGIRSKHYTYVRDLNGPWLLYDNQKDPYQENNLVGQSEYSDLQARLDKQLKDRLAGQNDDFLPGPDYIAKWGYTVDKNGTVPYKN